MSRRRAAKKKELMPDPKYGHKVITKFINCLMVSGKRDIAEKITYTAISDLSEKLGKEPVEIFEEALGNVKPFIEVKSRRVGGATYQVPMEIRPERSLALAIRWIINSARARKDHKTMSSRLFYELLDAHGSKGAAFKKKEDTHKMAEANKAFSHYRW